MKIPYRVVIVLAAAAVVAAAAPAAARKASRAVPPLLNRTMAGIDGKPIRLAAYQGKVLLIVNTASLCGNTPQYAGLERLYKKYASQGFVVLGFPANNFGAQEPGTNAQIQQFCSTHYQVTFPMFAKISVQGADQDPLYAYLTSPATNPGFSGPVEWNFAKFLVNRKGTVVARFPASHPPTEPDVVAAIEKALAEKP